MNNNYTKWIAKTEFVRPKDFKYRYLSVGSDKISESYVNSHS